MEASSVVVVSLVDGNIDNFSRVSMASHLMEMEENLDNPMGELSTNDNDSISSPSSSSDEEHMEIMELIENILDNATHFANKNHIVYVPKKVFVCPNF